MKISIIAIAAFSVVISACEEAEDHMEMGTDLREGLLKIQRDRELSDQEMVEGLQEWFSLEQMAMREDLWGQGGMDAFVVKMIEDHNYQLQRAKTMNRLSEVWTLEYLQKDDVDGARELLRRKVADRYLEELEKGTPRDDSMMAKVEELAKGDPELRRLMNKKPDGEQDAAPNP